MTTISEAIAERLSGIGPVTREKVIDHFALKLADKQANALIWALDKLDTMERDYVRMKPTQLFDGDGNVTSEAWTKDALDKRKKQVDQIDKLKRAITKADEKSDFGDLYNLAKSGGEKPSDAGE